MNEIDPLEAALVVELYENGAFVQTREWDSDTARYRTDTRLSPRSLASTLGTDRKTVRETVRASDALVALEFKRRNTGAGARYEDIQGVYIDWDAVKDSGVGINAEIAHKKGKPVVEYTPNDTLLPNE